MPPYFSLATQNVSSLMSPYFITSAKPDGLMKFETYIFNLKLIIRIKPFFLVMHTEEA